MSSKDFTRSSGFCARGSAAKGSDADSLEGDSAAPATTSSPSDAFKVSEIPLFFLDLSCPLAGPVLLFRLLPAALIWL
jgi:hypothetical protein